MKRKIIFILYVIIFLLVASINVISIKKFFDKKQFKKLDDIVANNYVVNLVSFNEEEVSEVVESQPENVSTEQENNTIIPSTQVSEPTLEIPKAAIEEKKEIVETNPIIAEALYDGLAEQELIDKLNRSLKNEIAETGIDFVNFYKNTGLDPYLAVAIVLHETGCSWNCSNLVKECFNVGGLKGGPNFYRDTRYTCYSSKDEGVNAYLNILYNNYYSQGLTTPELINPKYATGTTWAGKINYYIEKIKNN